MCVSVRIKRSKRPSTKRYPFFHSRRPIVRAIVFGHDPRNTRENRQKPFRVGITFIKQYYTFVVIARTRCARVVCRGRETCKPFRTRERYRRRWYRI